MTDTIKLFIGCSAGGEDAESLAVLFHTAKKHTSLPIEFHLMKANRNPDSPWGLWNMSRWATPFSGFRWAIPEVCKFEGKAIYMDSDMIIMRDLAELWNTPFQPGKVIQAKGGTEGWRYCTALFDCKEYAQRVNIIPIARMKVIEESHHRMMAFMANHQELVQGYDINWNCIDGEDYNDLNDPQIGIIHYSSMNHQPHLKYAIPRLESMGMKHWFDGQVQKHWRDDLIELFDKELQEAKECGIVTEQFIPEENERFIEYGKESQANYLNMHQWVA